MNKRDEVHQCWPEVPASRGVRTKGPGTLARYRRAVLLPEAIRAYFMYPKPSGMLRQAPTALDDRAEFDFQASLQVAEADKAHEIRSSTGEHDNPAGEAPDGSERDRHCLHPAGRSGRQRYADPMLTVPTGAAHDGGEEPTRSFNSRRSSTSWTSGCGGWLQRRQRALPELVDKLNDAAVFMLSSRRTATKVGSDQAASLICRLGRIRGARGHRATTTHRHLVAATPP